MRCPRSSTAAALVFVVAALGVAPAALAQRALSLDEALAAARQNNRDLRAARARLEQSAAAVELAWVAVLPQVVTQGRYTHNYKEVSLDLAEALNASVLGLAKVLESTSTDAAQQAAINAFEDKLNGVQSNPIVLQPAEQLNLIVNANVPLAVPHAYFTLKAAKEAEKASEANFSVSEATVLLAVAQTYYAAAGADELLVARKNAVALAREGLARAKAKFEAGSATSVDVSRAEVVLVRAEQAEVDTRDVQAEVYRALATQLGTTEPLKVLPAEVAPQEPAPEAALVEGALRLRPEFAFYRHSLQANLASTKSALWRWAPTLSAFGNVQAFNYESFSGDNYSWAVGLQLDWVLYDGGARTAQRHSIEAQRREQEARLDLLCSTVSDEVVNSRRALATRRRALGAATRLADLGKETLQLVQVQYEAGRVTQLDLLQAQDSLVAAELGVAQARFALAVTNLQLQRNAGTFPPKRSER